MPEVYRIHGALNVVALEAALGAMIERHESLRTIFIEIDGAPVQQIVPAAPFRLTVIDWRGRPQREARAETEQLIAQDARQPHELGDAPLMRASLLQLEEQEFVLLLNFHHIVCDAASLVIFYRELGQLYDGLAARTAANLPTLRVRYADFAAWQESQLSGPALAAQLDYWKARLDARLPSVDLPTDFARPPVQTYRGAQVRAAFVESAQRGAQGVRAQRGSDAIHGVARGAEHFVGALERTTRHRHRLDYRRPDAAGMGWNHRIFHQCAGAAQ